MTVLTDARTIPHLSARKVTSPLPSQRLAPPPLPASRQVGRVGDVEIEVLAVERITRRRPSRVAVLRSALSALGNMLRLATAWKLGGSAIASDAATTAGDATRLPAAWRVGGGVAASSGSAAAELQRQTASGSDAKLAGGAPAERTLWDLAPDTDSDADEVRGRLQGSRWCTSRSNQLCRRHSDSAR